MDLDVSKRCSMSQFFTLNYFNINPKSISIVLIIVKIKTNTTNCPPGGFSREWPYLEGLNEFISWGIVMEIYILTENYFFPNALWIRTIVVTFVSSNPVWSWSQSGEPRSRDSWQVINWLKSVLKAAGTVNSVKRCFILFSWLVKSLSSQWKTFEHLWFNSRNTTIGWGVQGTRNKGGNAVGRRSPPLF